MMDEFGYSLCRTCHGEYLSFTLTDGECDACRARAKEEQK